MADFILELYSEEMPARLQAGARAFCESHAEAFLKAAHLPYSAIESYVTPMRLVLIIKGLPSMQPDQEEERKGPRVDAPAEAFQGFLKSAGATADACVQELVGKHLCWMLRRQVRGRETSDVLAEMIAGLLHAFPWARSMRWGSSTFKWVRPLHHILAVFDGVVVPVTFELGGAMAPLKGQNITRGHRFMAPQAITVESPEGYVAALSKAYVVLDPAARAARILEEAQQLAQKVGFQIRVDDGLLQEVVGLVEWPHVLLGHIEQRFMHLPEELLVVVMRQHQRYFALEDASGKLAPYFAVVANIIPVDGGAAILEGNHRVIAARFSDAEFYWAQDQKLSLEDWRARLNTRTYHAKLGSVLNKADRLERLSAVLADAFADRLLASEVPKTDVVQAARLAKADLATGMVAEFPELQGVMGAYYARRQGLSPLVADAIRDHYAPEGPTARVPATLGGALVALSDKIDTLVGFFAAGEKPTSSKDPFALRRSALGLLRILFEYDLTLNLETALQAAYQAYISTNSFAPGAEAETEVVRELMAFIEERLKVYLKSLGWSHEVIGASFGAGLVADLRLLWLRGQALQAFLNSPASEFVVQAHRRASHILKKHPNLTQLSPDPAVFEHASEGHLWDAVQHAGMRLDHIKNTTPDNFDALFEALLTLDAPLSAFFEHVLVEDPNVTLRENRLALLHQLVGLYEGIADFTVL